MLIIWVEGQESFHMNVEWNDLQKALQGPSDSPAWYREIVCLHLLNLLRSESGDVQDLLRLLQTHPSDARGCSRLLTWTAPGLRCCLTGCERRHNTTYISLQADLEDVTYDNRITNDNSVIIYISNNVYIILKNVVTSRIIPAYSCRKARANARPTTCAPITMIWARYLACKEDEEWEYVLRRQWQSHN